MKNLRKIMYLATASTIVCLSSAHGEICQQRSIKGIDLSFSKNRYARHYLAQDSAIKSHIRNQITHFLQNRVDKLSDNFSGEQNNLHYPHYKKRYLLNHYSRSFKVFKSFENLEHTLEYKTYPGANLHSRREQRRDERVLHYQIKTQGELPDWQAESLIKLSQIYCEEDLLDLKGQLEEHLKALLPGLKNIEISSSNEKATPLFYLEDENRVSTNDPLWAKKVTGFLSLPKPINKSTPIHITMLDTGLLCHPDFCQEEKSLEGILDIPGLKNSNFGHGTRVYGLLKGERLGLVPETEITNFRVSKKVMAFGREIKKAAEEALEEVLKDNTDIVTISLGGPSLKSKKNRHHLEELYKRGVIVTAAAGNKIPFVVAPANLPTVIGTTACDIQKRPWDGSGYGPTAEICAPGVLVWHPRPKFYPMELKERGMDAVTFDFIQGNGTSLATPFVAAAAAKWLQYHGKEALKSAYSKPCYIIEAFRYALKKTASPLTGVKGSRHYGAGFLNTSALLKYPLPAEESLSCVL